MREMTWIEATTIGDLVSRMAERSDGVALAFPAVGFTYPELDEMTTRFARGLRALEVGRGDKVGIFMPNCAEFVAALIGAAKIGAIPVPINGRFKVRELGHVVAHADLRVLFTARTEGGVADYPALLLETFPGMAGQDPESLELAELPHLRQVIDMTTPTGFLGREDFERLAERVTEEEVRALQARVRVRDVGMLMYTSGTTAKPKGCLLTHEALVRHGRNVALTRFRLTAEDRFWDPLPLFHIGGIVPMLGCFSVGAAFHHAGHFNPDQAIDTLERERITVAYPAFETIWLGVLNHPRFAQADLSALRLIQNIAVPERLIQMQKVLPNAIEVSSFGATECSSNLTLPLPEDSYETRMYTLGRPLSGMEVRIVDPETGEERAPREVGELLFRGYARFEGYYKDPELTAQAIDEDGWFHSGDLAAVDDDGRLTYAGRLKDMLKVGGENVSALEIEDFLASHPAIDIVNVVSAPDARYTEVPAAFVQLKPGQTLTEQELIEFCVGQLATYKIPRYMRVVEEWPMSGTKIQKFVLRGQIAAELEQRGISEAPKIETSIGLVRQRA